MYTEEIRQKIEVLESGHVQVRNATVTLKDGVEVGTIYHRHVLHPGQDTQSETKTVKSVCSAVWTPAVLETFNKSIE